MIVASNAIGLADDRNRLNVLLILVDDLKPSFGAYGDEWVHAPNLDRLAASGIRFEAAYCNQAVCAPSRNNLLTGSRSTSLGIYNLGTHFRRSVPDAVTLPQFFRKHGYHSAGVGKVFHVGHGNVGDPRSWSEPFYPDKVIDYVLPESTGGKLTREEAYFSNQKLGKIRSLPRGAAWERSAVSDDAYADGRIAARAIQLLQQANNRDQPFFLAVGFVKPHLPFCAPEKYWDLYDRSKLPMPMTKTVPQGAPNFAPKFSLGEINQYKPIPDKPPLSLSMTQTLIHGYYAALSYMDAQLGRVLNELERSGMTKNTIVVLWGDHGYHLGDHGLWTKHTNYEQATRIPVIIKAPGVTSPASTSSTLIETVDLFPTICELAGLPKPQLPQPIDGRSLLKVLKDPNLSHRDHAYHCYPRRNRLGRAIRTSRYRLVEWKPVSSTTIPVEFELYDYHDDPEETKNVAHEQPEVLARLLKMLNNHPPAKPPLKK